MRGGAHLLVFSHLTSEPYTCLGASRLLAGLSDEGLLVMNYLIWMCHLYDWEACWRNSIKRCAIASIDDYTLQTKETIMIFIIIAFALLLIPAIGILRLNFGPGAETAAARDVRGDTTVGALIR